MSEELVEAKSLPDLDAQEVVEEDLAPKSDLPKAEITEEGECKLIVSRKGQLAEVFGDTSDAFGSVLLRNCFAAKGLTEKNIDTNGEVIEIVAALAPRDALEALLATQMAATHMAVMRHSTKMADAGHLASLETHERILTKLSRTFTSQMEALRKHRNGGKQTVTVQHVNVEGGGQAIVGSVSHREGGS